MKVIRLCLIGLTIILFGSCTVEQKNDEKPEIEPVETRLLTQEPSEGKMSTLEPIMQTGENEREEYDMETNPNIEREYKSFSSTGLFISKYEIPDASLITYGNVMVNDFIYEMKDSSGVIDEVIYSITEKKDIMNYAYKMDIDNDGQIEIVVYQARKGQQNLSVLVEAEGVYKLKYPSFSIEGFNTNNRAIEFQKKQYIAWTDVDEEQKGENSFIRHETFSLYSIENSNLVKEEYYRQYEDDEPIEDRRDDIASISTGFPEVESEMLKYDNVAAFVSQNHALKAKEKYETDSKLNPGEVSNDTFFKKYYPFTKEPVYGYQCDIFGDGRDERIIFRTGADKEGGTDIFIEYLDEDGHYKLSFAHDRMSRTYVEYEMWFETSKDIKTVIEVNNKCYIVGRWRDDYLKVWRDGVAGALGWDEYIGMYVGRDFFMQTTKETERLPQGSNETSIPADSLSLSVDLTKESSKSSPFQSLQYLSRSEENDFLIQTRMDRNKKLIELDGQKLKTKRDFYFLMAEKFSFPKEFAQYCDEEHFIANMGNIGADDKITGYVLCINNANNKTSGAMHSYITKLFDEKVFPYFSEKEIGFEVVWIE